MPDTHLLPLPDLITSTQALAATCKRLSSHTFVTVDTEFLRETTYYPKLCLIQIASAEEIVLIDPLAPELNLTPFFALMADANVTKVFHAARQDIEIIWHLGRIIPAPLFDTQIAAMVCGYGDQVSYESLATSLANARIDKSSRFTDWTRRPLTEAQMVYAAADVTHLRVVYSKLLARIGKAERLAWLADEMAILNNPKTYEIAPDEAWGRIKARIRKPAERAALMELAAWREREAQSRDVPRGRILKDDALVEIAIAQPKSIEELARLRALPQGFERSRAGGDILAAVKAGLARDPSSIPPVEAERASGSGALVQLLKVLLNAVSERNHVASRLIASSEEIDRLAANPNMDSPLLHGWRRAIYGDVAMQLIRGEVMIGLEKGRVVTFQRAHNTLND